MFARSISRTAQASVRGLSTSAVRADIAKVTLIGRLGTDPQSKMSDKTEQSYVAFPVATNNGGKPDANGQRATSWHRVLAFNEYHVGKVTGLGRGSKVYIEADLIMKESGRETDSEGRPITSPMLILKTLSVLDKKPRADQGNGEAPVQE